MTSEIILARHLALPPFSRTDFQCACQSRRAAHNIGFPVITSKDDLLLFFFYFQGTKLLLSQPTSMKSGTDFTLWKKLRRWSMWLSLSSIWGESLSSWSSGDVEEQFFPHPYLDIKLS